MEIILVRHGEPAWVEDGRTVHDPGLTPLGVAQARAVASRLAALDGIDEILVSPARRAAETAAPLEHSVGKTAITIADLVEIRVPWDDTPSHLVERALSEARNRPIDEWWEGFTGGESFRDFHVRVVEAVESLLRQRGVQRHPTRHLWNDDGTFKRIVIVAHGGTNAVALGHLLDLDPTPWEWERFRSNHGATIRICTQRLAGAHIMSLWEANGVAHLAPNYLTI